jgi:hypothetical protein
MMRPRVDPSGRTGGFDADSRSGAGFQPAENLERAAVIITSLPGVAWADRQPLRVGRARSDLRLESEPVMTLTAMSGRLMMCRWLHI